MNGVRASDHLSRRGRFGGAPKTTVGWAIKTEMPAQIAAVAIEAASAGSAAFSLRRRLLFNRGDGLQMTEVAGRGTGELVLGNDVRIDSYLEEYPEEGYVLEVVELFIPDFAD